MEYFNNEFVIDGSCTICPPLSNRIPPLSPSPGYVKHLRFKNSRGGLCIRLSRSLCRVGGAPGNVDWINFEACTAMCVYCIMDGLSAVHVSIPMSVLSRISSARVYVYLTIHTYECLCDIL